MKILGIDYGSKRVGLALSDESGQFALPYSTVTEQEAIEKIISLIKEVGIDTIVMGESKDYSGKDNKIMEESRDFAKKIEQKTGINVQFEAEFMTSHQAERLQYELGGVKGEKGKMQNVDASAAAIILQSFIDRRKNSQK